MSKTSYTESGVRGQQVKCATGRDDSSYKVDDKVAREGRSMGGGKDNLSHSLSGASAVQNAMGNKK
jgi:hypothetical protein